MGSSKSFYSGFTLQFSPTSWRTLREFIIFEEYLHVLVPTKTYSKKSQTSVTKETNQIHSDTSLPSFISPDMFVPAETSAFAKEDTSFNLVSANESASGEELGSVKLYFVVGGTDSN